MRLAPALLALLALPASASAQTAAEAAVLPRLIDRICVNLIPDRNGCETAVLLASETNPDASDLILFSDRRAHGPQEILATVRDIAFSGPFFGQNPSLAQSDSGALLLHSEQVAVGRTPWTQTLTIEHLDNGLFVTDLSYSTYDRAEGGGFSCVINFLTGQWATNADRVNPETGETTYDVSATGQLDAARPALGDWSNATPLPTPCAEAVSAWFAARDP